jgi:hypothetical protein
MFGRTFFRVLLIVILGLGAVALGAGAYQAGLAAGIAADGVTVVPVGGPLNGYGYGWHPFGVGFGFLGFLGTLLFVLLIVAIVRAAFWGGRGLRGGGNWGGPGRWAGPGQPDHRGRFEDRAHDAFDEWHRRAHGEADPDGTADHGRADHGRPPDGPTR